jgi:D-lactate dehydrogenase
MENNYDIIHFEALGEEASHLEKATQAAQQNNSLPADMRSLITPDTIQEFLRKNPGVVLPDVITTKTHSLIPGDYLKTGAKKSIVTRTTGYDHFEHLINEANFTTLREYCVSSVAQTAIKLVYATAGLLNHYMEKARTFERNDIRSFIELTPDRVATVFGLGRIGKKVHDLLACNGLTVQAFDFAQDKLESFYDHTVKFVSKEEALANSHFFINTMSMVRTPESKSYNVNFFSKEYLSRAKPGLVFINVARAEVAPEAGLLELYDRNILGGIGLDVFSEEESFSRVVNGEPTNDPNLLAAKEMLRRSLERSANIYIQPHQGFNSDAATVQKAYESIRHVAAWYRNDKKRFDSQLPYYQG